MSKYQKYLDASEKAADFFVKNIGEDGEFKGPGHKRDLSAIYKAPTLLLLSGNSHVATRLLEYIQRTFGQPNGDFLSFPEKSQRSANMLLKQFQPYMGGWIATAAQRAGRFDISRPAYDHLQTYWNPKSKSFISNEPYNPETGGKGQIHCTLISSHLGLIALYFGDLEKARGAGDIIVKIVESQKDLQNRFVLRMWSGTQELITDKVTFEEEPRICTLKTDGKYERFFMLGFPVIFLGKLYQATKEVKYLENAKKVLDYSLTCDDSIYSFYLSHKVGYGAAIIANITKETKYVKLAERIADYLVSCQDADGVFAADKMEVRDDRYDQVSEIGVWLREIYTELTGV